MEERRIMQTVIYGEKVGITEKNTILGKLCMQVRAMMGKSTRPVY